MSHPAAPSPVRLGLAVLCTLLAVVFFGAGVVKLIPIDFERTNFLRFGYATWFMTLVGLAEIAGAALMIFATTRAAGALLNAAIMVGAVCSHLRAGDGFGMATPAFVLLLLLIVVAVAARAPLERAVRAGLVGRPA